jgi:acyl-coenzyme A thioesterase PaaI-like protein
MDVGEGGAPPGREEQGAPEVVHGGIQAVLLDETCCAAAYFIHGGFVVTGTLNLRYRRPCPIGRPLEVTARIIERFGRLGAPMQSRLPKAGSTRTLLVRPTPWRVRGVQ